jgi:autotransporter-associated beta strand protein
MPCPESLRPLFAFSHPQTICRFTAFLFSLAVVIGPGTALAQRPLGIDVSSYQGGSIDWTSVSGSGIVFAWAKATEGGGVNDADFVVNENNGKAAGVYMGAYHYAHPELNSPSTEASHFWSIAGNYIKADGKTLMPMLDIEGSAFSGHVGAASLSAWINAWCTDVVQDAANAGVTVKPAIYVSACNACNFDGTVSQWNNDIADYNGADPLSSTPWTTCTSCERWGSGGWNFWQYTSTGTIPGISGNVDHDVFNGTSASLVSTMIATASTNSAIFYWDPQATGGADPYTGTMTGTWENNQWSYGPSGLASPVGWVGGKAACFGVHTGAGTPAYTVTMNSSHVVAGFFDGALAPNSCDITIQGSGVINLASGAQALDSVNSSDGSVGLLRINVEIAGDGQLFPEGNGQSFLRGTNSYTGGTQLGFSTVPFTGTVNFNNGSAFGSGTITLWSHGNGGQLVLEGAGAVTVPNDVAVTTATTNNIVGNAAGLTFSGDWSLGGNLLTLGAGGTAGKQTIISGVVSGTAGLTIYNSGTVVLSGVNTFTGTTTINSPAVLAIGGAGQLGSGAHAGNIVNNGTFRYDSTATQILSGTISGTGALVKTNSGTLVLTHAETYTGATTIRAGTLALGSAGAIGASAVTVFSGAAFSNAATTTRAVGGATVLNSGARASFTAAGGGSSVVGKISVTGNLTLNANVLTANVTGSALAVGTYRLLDCTGALSGSANAVPTITGTPLAGGYTAAIATTAGVAGHVDLTVKATPAFSNLAASPQITYGSPSVSLGGALSANGPLYPASGETVTVTINGNAQATTVNDATGDFSINYNTFTLSVTGSPYTVTYSYAGNASLNATSDISTTLTVTVPPFSVTSQYLDATGTNFIITWQSAPGATYHVLGNTNPAMPLNLWTDVAGSITATGTTTSVTIPITSPLGVFDVKSP